MAFEEFEYKDVKGERSYGFFASNAHPSNLVTFVRGQSASVCCHTDKLTQKPRTLSRGRVGPAATMPMTDFGLSAYGSDGLASAISQQNYRNAEL